VIPIKPNLAILIGFLMVLAGVVLPFLMVMKVVESTLFMNFFSFTISIAGLFLGIIGAASIIRKE